MELEHPEDRHLHVSDLGGGVGPVGHVGKVRDLRGIHLLVFGSKKHGSHTDQLQLFLGDWVFLLEGKRLL